MTSICLVSDITYKFMALMWNIYWSLWHDNVMTLLTCCVYDITDKIMTFICHVYDITDKVMTSMSCLWIFKSNQMCFIAQPIIAVFMTNIHVTLNYS